MEADNVLKQDAIELLKKLISKPSFSREEELTAYCIEEYFRERSIPFSRLGNNVWGRNRHFDWQKPSILLNSHHDTVKPNASYTRNPFLPTEENGRLYGLGSNDAGGALVALLAAFTHFYDRSDLPFNLVFAASAEEEISGSQGIEALLKELPPFVFGIVGEPTSLNLAIAEKGLMVLDCLVTGKAGHAAREEGENAITKAMPDIQWFQKYTFAKESAVLGKIKMSLTVIEAGSQHNVVPDVCKMVVDIRVTDAYTLEETLKIIQEHVKCQVKPRSMRLNPSGLRVDHPIIEVANELKISTFGSPTMSDQALMPFDTVKIGPGDSARSHTADEYIELKEVKKAIDTYICLIEIFKKYF